MPMNKFCYISGNKKAFLLLIFAKAGESIWPLFSALAISTPETIRPGMGKYPKDTHKSKIMYDQKNHDHTRAEYRTKNVGIGMIIMKVSKVIIIRLSYCFVFFVQENAIFWAKMCPK